MSSSESVAPETTTPPSRTGSDATADPLIGRRLGNIRVDRLLGEGGMGKVYAGFDEKLQRPVALKSIRRSHADNQEMRRRFLREAQILSRLRHPNICAIYDYHEGEQADFLVLELIDGRTLRDQNPERLSFEDKLRIAEQLTSALAAAHDAGIVHRDLKPANVMLNRAGNVKMLDFGIAQISDAELRREPTTGQPSSPNDSPGPNIPSRPTAEEDVRSKAPLVTAQPTDLETTRTLLLASESLGTDFFAKSAPGEGTSGGLDSDSGTGPKSSAEVKILEGATRPFGQSTVPADRDFRTRTGSVVGTPQSMSPEQARGERADAAGDMYSLGLLYYELFTHQRPYPDDLGFFQLLETVQSGRTRPLDELPGVDALPDDLRALIERLCSLAPGSRPSALDTGERLRWIRDTPARRRRKLWRRSAVAASVFVALIMTFLVLRVTQEAERARHAAARAAQEAETNRRTLDFFIALFDASDPWESRRRAPGSADTTVREALERGIERLGHDLKDQPRIRAQLLHSVGRVGTRVGDLESTEALLRESLEWRQTHQPEDPAIGRNLADLGDLLQLEGRFEEAEQALRSGLDHLDRFGGTEHRGDSVLALRLLGTLLAESGRFDEAESRFREALALQDRGGSGLDKGETALNLAELATVQEQKGDLVGAEESLRNALEQLENHYGEKNPFLAVTFNRLGVVLDQQRRVDEAVEAYERALRIATEAFPAGHPMRGSFHMNLGSSLREQNRFDEAEDHYRQAEEIFRTAFSENHPRMGELLGNLGNMYHSRGHYRDAGEAFEAARNIFVGAFGEVHPAVALCDMLRGAADQELGELARAEGNLRSAAKIFETVFGPDHPESRSARRFLAKGAVLRGKLDEARSLLDGIEPTAEAPEDRRTEVRRLVVRLQLELEAGDLVAAEAVLDGLGRPGDDEVEPIEDRQIFRLLLSESRLRQEQGDTSKAWELLSEAEAKATSIFPRPHPSFIQVFRRQATLLDALGRPGSDEKRRAADQLVREFGILEPPRI